MQGAQVERQQGEDHRAGNSLSRWRSRAKQEDRKKEVQQHKRVREHGHGVSVGGKKAALTVDHSASVDPAAPCVRLTRGGLRIRG